MSLNFAIITAAALMLMLLFAGSPAEARCCSVGGGGASYNYLGDSAMNMDMDSYDEFLHEYGESEKSPSAEASAEKDIAASSDETDVAASGNDKLRRLIISLNDSNENTSFDLLLASGEDGLSGEGNMTDSEGTRAVQAEGRQNGGILFLNVTASLEEICTLLLAEEESSLHGSFSMAGQNQSDKINLTGAAQGKWE